MKFRKPTLFFFIETGPFINKKEEKHSMTPASASREQIISSSRVRLGAMSLVLSGILFVLYPLLRPFSDESSLQCAQAFASSACILAHMLGGLGFILIALCLLCRSSALLHTAAPRLASLA